ncbi:hypothetical protein [Nocardia sp. NPDC049526]|uniref:hypothetical protein n=1 Tax=Nocardia sp. NPDC049526 TaxID=3364316 RepID=UPI0037945016
MSEVVGADDRLDERVRRFLGNVVPDTVQDAVFLPVNVPRSGFPSFAAPSNGSVGRDIGGELIVELVLLDV